MSDSASLLTGIQKISRDPLREQVRVQIKALVLTNHLHPGQPIVIDQLANDLGVSHTPVREALAMLEHEGLVTMKPYENPRVADVDALYVREAWEMRILLEGWGVRRAALSLPEAALDDLARSLDTARQETLASRYSAHLQADMALHGTILHAAGNSLYERLAQSVNDQSIRARSLVEAIATADEVLQIIDEHCALVEALRSRDPDLASQRLVAHLEAGRQRTLAALKVMEARSP